MLILFARLCVIGAGVVLVISLLYLAAAIRAGHDLRKMELNRHRRHRIDHHKSLVTVWLVLTLIVVTLSAIAFHLSGMPYPHTFLFYVHWTVDGVWLVLLTLALWFNGKKHPRVHKFIVYPLAIDYAVVVLTGVYNLWMVAAYIGSLVSID